MADDRRAVRLEWSGRALEFTARGTLPETSAIVIDGDAAAGPSPMVTLLLAAGGCTAADVVWILGKMRVRLERCVVEVEGIRRSEEPRRYTALRFRYRLSGTGLDRARAERAISLSLEKYCSVVHSLAPDLRISYDVDLG